MARKETCVQIIARSVSERFPLRGVNIEQLVRFVLAKRNALESARRQKTGDDARDYMNTAFFLRSLSNKELIEITNLSRGDIHRHLREKIYPFSRLNQNTRETLLHLPNSWVHGAAEWLLATYEF